MSGIVCTHMNIGPGKLFSVKLDVLPDAKGFACNMGKNKDDIILHFNARFDCHGDIKTIVCNSKSKGQWGKEHRETNFPFQQGSPAEVFFTHDKKEVTITLPGDHQFKFPNDAGTEGIEYVCVDGDVLFKGLLVV